MLSKEKKEKIDHLLNDLLAVPEKGAHQITIKLIRLMNEIVSRLYEIENVRALNEKPSNHEGYISTKDFIKKHGRLISSSRLYVFCQNQLKNDCVRTVSGWMLDEAALLKLLIKHPLFRDRILANREKYQHILT